MRHPFFVKEKVFSRNILKKDIDKSNNFYLLSYYKKPTGWYN